MSGCLQEDCANWDGHSCPCSTLDLDPVDVRQAAGCRLCGCAMDDHNDPRQGGGCTDCGDCEGWL